MELKERKDMAAEFKWDLSSLFGSDESFESTSEVLLEKLEELKELKGHVAFSSDTLKRTLELSLELSRMMGNIYTYAHMKRDEDTRVSKYQSYASKAESLNAKLGSESSFIVPEILAAEESVILGYLESDNELSLYSHYLDDILRGKKHTLSVEEETILAGASELASAPSTIFGMLNNADFKFPEIKDEEGNLTRLTHGNYRLFIESKDRRVRKDAFEAMYSVYKDHRNALASSLQSEVKKNIFFAKTRKHESARASALFGNSIPETVYDNLIDSVHRFMPAMHKYVEVRKKALGLDELHMYDIYTPLVKDVDFKVPYEEATATVLKALAPLGEDYTSVVEKAYDDKWIDVYENEGKRSGAYSWGTYDSKPYILLNYHDNLDNMFTLAHEMGHSMHSYYTKTSQPFVYGHYSIFLAEIASTCNEALLNHYLLENETDRERKLYILNHYLETFKGTVFRQTMFAEFERDIHRAVESGEALTSESLNIMYRELNRKYFGDDAFLDDEIDFEWSRIPHFYYNFYVFQYATGFSAAVSLADRIIKGEEGAVDKYLGYLSAGSSDYPIEVLKKAGLDMTKPDAVDGALSLFEKLVGEFENLLLG